MARVFNSGDHSDKTTAWSVICTMFTQLIVAFACDRITGVSTGTKAGSAGTDWSAGLSGVAA